MTMSKAVALRLDKLLQNTNFTIAKFARHAGIPVDTLKGIYRGEYLDVKSKTIFSIARGLNISVSKFYDDPIFESDNLIID